MSYLIASNLDQVLTSLRDGSGKARVVAGATDLYLQDLPYGLVDLSTLPETTVIEEKDGLVRIGAAVTHTAAANSPLVLARARALAEGCAAVGSPQIRNLGTIGGNVVNAAPAADAAVALVGLGAEAVIIDIEGNRRQEAVENLYWEYNRSLIDSTREVMLSLQFKSCIGKEGSAFTRFAARRALALPMVNAAARIKLENGLIKEVRLIVAPVRPAPTRLVKTEGLIVGRPVNGETISMVEKAAAEEVEVRGSLLRCSARYRLHLVGVLVARVLKTAAVRAGDSGKAGE
ncbi:MAG: FAD binding domain-containing protein [Bacillota bacterium]